MNTSKATDIADIREEINTENEATAEARRVEEIKKRDAERRAIYVTENKKYMSRVLPHVIDLLPSFPTVRQDAFLNETNGYLVIGGVDTTYQVTIQDEYTKTSFYRSRATGKKRIVVGQYGDRTSYPERKDGTHNYEAIANKLLCHAAAMTRRSILETTRKMNQDCVKAFENGAEDYKSYGNLRVEASQVDTLPLRIELKVTRDVTVETAIALHAALKKLNLV